MQLREFTTADEFFSYVRSTVTATRNCAKAAVLVPAGWVGLNAGLGFPDKDISLLGIGSHRYFLFHSAIGVFVLKKLYDRYLLCDRDHPDLLTRVASKVGGAFLGCAAVGMGVHLLIDVFQPKTVIFPFIGSLVNGTLVDDRLWLLGNSLWCFKMARDVLTASVGDELAAVKDYAVKNYGWSRTGRRKRGVRRPDVQCKAWV